MLPDMYYQTLMIVCACLNPHRGKGAKALMPEMFLPRADRPEMSDNDMHNALCRWVPKKVL